MLEIPKIIPGEDFEKHFQDGIRRAVAVEVCRRERIFYDEIKRLASSDHVVYGIAEKDLNGRMRRRLMMLTMLYEIADLRRYALRLKPEAVDYSLAELEKAVWSFAGDD